MLRAIALVAFAAGVVTSAWSQVSVSAMGQPTFGQPISVPPGVGGMTPQLSLMYAGSGVNGPLGHAWSLQGVSTITRCSAEVAIDGAAMAVAYGAADKLCLDGQRLIPTDASGTPLPPGSVDASGLASGHREYRTTKDTYTRIRAYGIAGAAASNGPLYFKAWTKAGQVFEYGQPGSTGATPKALVLAQGRSVVMAWAVARVSDVVGNYMDFHYSQRTVAFGSGPVEGAPTPGVEWNLESILYSGKTGNGARAPYNEVRFDYVDRTDGTGRPRDRSEAYHAGSKNVSVARLDRIRSFVGISMPQPVLVRTTQLDYETAALTGRSRLKGVRECFGESTVTAGEPGAKCAPWARFTYADTGHPELTMRTNFNLSNLQLLSTDGKYGVLTGDFNGDGRTDIFRWSSATSSENLLYYSDGDGTFTKESALNLPHLLFTADGCYHSIVADMNADGLPDIVRFAGKRRLDGGTCTLGGDNSIAVFKNNGAGGFGPQVLQAKNLAGVTAQMAPERVSSVQTTVRYCEHPPNLLPMGPGATMGEKPAPLASCPGGYTDSHGWTYGATFYLMDVNGDGRTDIVTSTLPAQPAPDPYDFEKLPTDACPAGTTCTRVYMADATGLMVESATNASGETLYSEPGKAGDLQYQRRLADVDGDGFVDLAAVGKQGSLGNWRSAGNANFYQYGGSTNCERPLDFNGDGRSDCLYAYAGAPTSSKLFVSVGNAPGGTSSVEVADFNLNTSGHPLIPADDIPVGSRYGHFMVDWNSDGRTDIFRWHDSSSLNRLYLSNGDGTFRLDTPGGYLVTRLKSSDGKFDVVQGDFLGSGTPDLLRLSSDAPSVGSTDYAATNNLYSRISAELPDRLLTATSPTGLVTRVGYGTLVNGSSQYLSDRGTVDKAIYPLVDVAAGWPVVTSLNTDSGAGNSTVTINYSYRGLKASVDGSGVFGFRAMRTQSPAPNGTDHLTTATVYHLKRPYAGVARNTETRLATLASYDAASTLSKTSNTYCDTTSATAPDRATEDVPCATSATIVRPYLRKSVESGSDLVGTALPQVVTVNTYNATGDPTSIVVTTTGQVAGVGATYTKTTSNEYEPAKTDADSWILGRLKSATVSNKVPNLGLTPSPGTAPNATKTTGIGLP